MQKAEETPLPPKAIAKPPKWEAIVYSSYFAQDVDGIFQSRIIRVGEFDIWQHAEALETAEVKCIELNGIGFAVERREAIPNLASLSHGSTIRDAKRIVGALQFWASDNLKADQLEIVNTALLALSNTLETGWTEVDEALCRISPALRRLHAAHNSVSASAGDLLSIGIGMGYLHRWQGRNGRMGNIEGPI